MKKVLALLLVLCTLFGLVACGKKEPSSSSNPTNPTNTTDPTSGIIDDPQFQMTPENSPYNGKTLQIYGFMPDSYTDYSTYTHNYNWMERAAMEEWAAMNGVTLEFKGGYNQAAILAQIQAGSAPDLCFYSEQFPKCANAGIVTGFTTEEYNKLAAICGKEYLDMLKYKNEAVGFIRPWVGNNMCYYNKTMFEDYGVKTPKEYFMEGDWTWSNFVKCIDAMTQDVNADGTIDTYGLNGDSLARYRLFNPIKYDESGKVLSVIDEPIVQDFFQLKYDCVTVKGTIIAGANRIQTNVTYPMFAMQLGDCEPYNFKHLYQIIEKNGNELEAVPAPAYDGSGEHINQVLKTQSCISMIKSCDEREAAVDLLAYLLKCGLKYISDYSLGVVECNYPGIQGKSEVSKQYKEAFAKLCEERAAELAEIENYDPEFIKKMYESFEGAQFYTYQTLSGVKELPSYSEITQMPPASSIPAIREKYQAALDKYNELYITKS